MVRINQEDIDRFTGVTGLPSFIAIQKIKEHHGNVVDALDAFYIEAEKSITQDTVSAAPQKDVMGVADPQSLKSIATDENLFFLIDHLDIFYCGPLIQSHTHSVSHPREVPIEDKDRIGVSGRSGTRASTAINVPGETDDIEKAMVRAAIKASKEDMEMEMDIDLALALSLSLQTVEEKATMDLNKSVEASEQEKIEELPS